MLGCAEKLTQPVVDPEPSLSVEKNSVLDTDEEREAVQRVEGEAKTNVGKDNERSLARAEHTTPRVKVAAAAERSLVLHAVATGGDVEDQVEGPSQGLVEEKADDVVDGGVLEEVELGEKALQVISLGAGSKGHILVHVASEAVVAVVGELPGEVGDAKNGVREPADNVVEGLVLGEGAMAALVAQNPDAGANEALNVAVDDPGERSQVEIRNGGNVGDGSITQADSHAKITDQVGQSDDSRGLKAVLGDGIPDGVDVRELRFRHEPVSISSQSIGSK
jgi:hypothetical protein